MTQNVSLRKTPCFVTMFFERLVATFATKTSQELSKTSVDYSFPPQKPLRHLALKISVLSESVNEGWNNSIPITNTRPQPDFSVGFRRSVFSDDQFSKLQPLLGDPSYLSYFRATYYMYFPVLTCETKCGTTGLDIANRQNAHSMTLAVRGIVELFKLAKKENTLHREILTFSISHDHRTVRLYGYYPIIDGPRTKIYRHPIHTFDIIALDGEERWRTYKFTVGVYSYSLTLLKKIRSVFDELPRDFSLKLAQSSEPQLSEPSGLSLQLEDQMLTENTGGQRIQVNIPPVTPETSTRAEIQLLKRRRRSRRTPETGAGRLSACRRRLTWELEHSTRHLLSCQALLYLLLWLYESSGALTSWLWSKLRVLDGCFRRIVSRRFGVSVR